LPNALLARHGAGAFEWWTFKGYEARKDAADQWVLRKAGTDLYRHTYPQVVMARAERAILAAAHDAQPYAMQFTTMLRKRWSGTEVQAWLDELPPLYVAPTSAQESGEAEASPQSAVERVQCTPSCLDHIERTDATANNLADGSVIHVLAPFSPNGGCPSTRRTRSCIAVALT
jgi:hypothetical protein